MSTDFAGNTRVVLLLDRSGSMTQVWDATIEGINGYFQGLQQNDDGRHYATLLLFDRVGQGWGNPLTTTPHDDIEILCTGVRVNRVPVLDRHNYVPRGATPLFDAIGKAVQEGDRQQQAGDRVLLVIQTDGLENASTEITTPAMVKALLDDRQAKGWTVVFLSAGPDAFAHSRAMGIPDGNTRTYTRDADSTRVASQGLGRATAYYSRGAGGQSVGSFWAGDEDQQAVPPLAPEAPVAAPKRARTRKTPTPPGDTPGRVKPR